MEVKRKMVSSEQAAENIRIARLKKNYTQEYVSEAIGVSVPTYRKVEQSPYDYPVKLLEDVAQALENTLDDFLLG